MVKIAVYTIALNEEKFLLRWYNSAKDADLLLIADTGSTDRTVEKAQKLGIHVEQISVVPWRFDVARNLNLDMIPEDFDICIQLDMDEILPEGWREIVEAAYHEGNVWPEYKHTLVGDGWELPQTYFKIHPRHGLRWKFPIHEMLVAEPGYEFTRKRIDLEVKHIQDLEKSRSSYLELIELGVEEDPTDWRMLQYLQWDYFLRKRWNDVLKVGSRVLVQLEPLNLSVEKAATCMWSAEAAFELGYHDWAIEWADRAIWYAPLFFEAKGVRALLAYRMQDWNNCYKYAIQISTHSRQEHHLARASYWDWFMYDLIALSAHHLGKQSEAINFGELAIQGNPNEPRLKDNMKYYTSGTFSPLDK
ncbi:MAG: glycosyltransferase [Candidatus Nanopelagicales bacterium]